MMSGRVFVVLAVVLIVAAIGLSFELGRNRAGFSLLDQRREQAAFDVALASRDEQIDALERELAILRTSSQIDNEASATVRADLADIETRLQTQAAELAFYRGIVSPGEGEDGLRIQSVGIEAVGSFSAILRVLLVQNFVDSEQVKGEVRARVRGSLDGEAAEYALETLVPEGEPGVISFEFRYFQAVEAMLVLPEGFAPVELEVEVWPGSPQGETIVQSFPWGSFEG